MAVPRLKYATRVSRILSWFPYTRGVAISGSLSKNVAYKDSDLDFFIITAANRLWIARSIMFLFIKGLAWTGIRRVVCINYYIDEQALEIEERNIFTAIEIATLLPAQGKQIFQGFHASNSWIYGYLPNARCKSTPEKELSSGPLKQGIEWLLNNKVGDRIDNWLLAYFTRRWKKLVTRNKLTPKGFPCGGFATGKHLYKPDPKYFQRKVLTDFQEKISSIQAPYTVAAADRSTSSSMK
jgi:hypothetical protein